jgi:spectinomycin phosphotransferase
MNPPRYMREPPANLSVERLRACLREQYRLAATEIEFLPLGHDPAAGVYRIETTGGRYFLKACLRIRSEAGLRVPRYLQDQGISYVFAPLPTVEGALWSHAGSYDVVLYPFIAGTNGMQQRLSDQQWVEYGTALRQLHETAVTPELTQIVGRDTFEPPGADLVRQLDEQIGDRSFEDAAHHALAEFWQAHRAEIHLLLERAERLGARLAESASPLVLCHADIHTGNVLVGQDQRIWIVDWDETVLAPRERDLMFVIGGISSKYVTPREERLFRQGYGEVTVDQLALAFYRYAWAVSDISAFGETILLRADLSQQLRLSEVEMFRSLFAPGNIVEIAFQTPLPPP